MTHYKYIILEEREDSEEDMEIGGSTGRIKGTEDYNLDDLELLNQLNLFMNL